jgi:predicted RNA-binding protein with PIN domain
MKLLIIDGYNVMHHWKALKKTAKKDYEFARDELIRIIKNYADYSDTKIIFVFDGGRHPRPEGKLDPCIIFTDNKVSADHYIERFVFELEDRGNATVATNDRVLQNMIQGMGALSMSTENLESMVQSTLENMRDNIEHHNTKNRRKW